MEGFITRRGGSPLKYGSCYSGDYVIGSSNISSITIPELIGYKDFVLISDACDDGEEYVVNDYHITALYVENGIVTRVVYGVPVGSGHFKIGKKINPETMTYDVSTGTITCSRTAGSNSYNFAESYIYLYF